MDELPLRPLAGSPVPVTVMPSVLEAEAAKSELLGELARFGHGVCEQGAEETGHELWRIAVGAGWIRPAPGGPEYGATMRLWEPADPDLTPAQALGPWLEVFRVLLAESPELIETLLIAFRDGGGDRIGTGLLERLGAVAVVDGRLRLTALGVRGLFTRWLLDPGEWWANLPPEDLVAFLTAASRLCVVDQAETVQRWFDQADPLDFAYQLVMVADRVGGAVLNTVFGYLLRIGLDAAPAVEEWLVVEDLSGFGWRWFDAIGAPMAGIPSEHAQYLVKTAMVQSLDDFRALLDRYAECPPGPPLSGPTIDELMFSLPLRIRTDRVNALLHRVLTAPSPTDRAELDLIVAEARREFLH